METITHFYTDKEIARKLNMSPSWVRGQRHKRNHNQPCIFDLKPCYIGSCARYKREDVDAFIAKLSG